MMEQKQRLGNGYGRGVIVNGLQKKRTVFLGDING